MDITSFFIGIKVEESYFVSLFVQLQEYLKKHNIEDAIQLDNILSLHFTLYYFDKSFVKENLEDIKKQVDNLNLKDNFISAEKLCYFNRDSHSSIGYLSPNNSDLLNTLNKDLSQKYKLSDIPDNSYPYIPHLSLFKIYNTESFKKYEQEINRIIETSISRLNGINITKGVNLFAVNSKISPEIQIPIDIHKNPQVLY